MQIRIGASLVWLAAYAVALHHAFTSGGIAHAGAAEQLSNVARNAADAFQAWAA